MMPAFHGSFWCRVALICAKCQISPLMISYLAPAIGWAEGFSWCALLPLVLSGAVFLALENRRSDEPMEEGALRV